MRFSLTNLDGAVLIEPEPIFDERGSFTRTFCEDAFGERGLETSFPQHSTSYNRAAGTLRGLHYQREPHGEAKVVHCLRGAVWDVIVDLRLESPSYGRWQGFELSAVNCRRLYIPRGFGHGFQSLTADAEMGYLISVRYEPSAAAGVRFDDPALMIDWPLPVSVISDKDAAWPLLGCAGDRGSDGLQQVASERRVGGLAEGGER